MKESYRLKMITRKDRITNTGFDYKGLLFRRTLSSYQYEEPIKEEILDKLDGALFHIIESIKNIKKSVNYAFRKDYTKFN